MVCSAPKKLYALDDIALWLAGHTIWLSGCGHSSMNPLQPWLDGLARASSVVLASRLTATDPVRRTATTMAANTATTCRLCSGLIVWSVTIRPLARRHTTMPT